jgi:hypothetical protein
LSSCLLLTGIVLFLLLWLNTIVWSQILKYL